VKHGSIKWQKRHEQKGVEHTEAQGSPGRHKDLPFRDVGEAASGVSGTVFWVKALPPVMTSFSRASFD